MKIVYLVSFQIFRIFILCANVLLFVNFSCNSVSWQSHWFWVLKKSRLLVTQFSSYSSCWTAVHCNYCNIFYSCSHLLCNHISLLFIFLLVLFLFLCLIYIHPLHGHVVYTRFHQCIYTYCTEGYKDSLNFFTIHFWGTCIHMHMNTCVSMCMHTCTTDTHTLIPCLLELLSLHLQFVTRCVHVNYSWSVCTK